MAESIQQPAGNGRKSLKSRRGISPKMLSYLRKAALLNPDTPATDIGGLAAKEGLGGPPPDRTLRDIVSEIRARPGPSEPWTIADSPGGESRLVLETWAALAVEHNSSDMPPSGQFSKAEAEWIIRIGQAAPWVAPRGRYVHARLYLRASPEERARLDWLLAAEMFTEEGSALRSSPWRDGSFLIEDSADTTDGEDGTWVTLLVVPGKEGPHDD